MHIFIIFSNKDFFIFFVSVCVDFLDLIWNSGALVFKTKG